LVLPLSIALAFGNAGPLLAEGPIVVDGSTATTLSTSGNVTNITTATIHGQNAFNSFKSFNVSGGQTVNLHTPHAADNLINLVTGGQLSRVDGTLNMLKQGKLGGNVFLVNPSGLVVGQTGLINAAQLTIMTPKQDTVTNFFDANGIPDPQKLGSIIAGSAEINPGATVDIQGRINTTDSLNVITGTINVAGQLRAGKAVDVDQLVNTAGVVAAETVVKRDGRIFLSADSGTMTLTGDATATSADQDAAGTIALRGQGNTTVAAGAAVAAGQEGYIELDSGRDLLVNGTVSAGSETSPVTGAVRMTSQESTSIGGHVLGDTTVLALRDFHVTGTIRAPGADQGPRGGSVLLYAGRAGDIRGGTIDTSARGLTSTGGQINIITAVSGLTLENATLRATGPQPGRVLCNVAQLTDLGGNTINPAMIRQDRLDELAIDGSNLTSGLDFIGVANKRIVITAGSTIDTRVVDGSHNPIAGSGRIFLQAGTVDVGAGSSLLTGAGESLPGGDITILTTANFKDNPSMPNLHIGDNATLAAGSGTVSLLSVAVNPNVAVWFYQNYGANIQIDKATISGNVVSISALASSTSKLDLTFSPEHQPGSEPYMTDFHISEGPGFSVFAAATFAWTDAQVSLQGANIQAGQSLTVSSESFSSAQNQAIGILAAATAASSNATATTHIGAGTTLTSAGSLNVSSKVKSQAVTTALGVTTGGKGLTAAVLVGNAHANTTIDAGATLGGAVTNVAADSMGIYVAESSTIPMPGGTVPITGAVAVNYNDTSARCNVAGVVRGTAGATISSTAITGESKSKAAAPSFNGDSGFPAIEGLFGQIKRWLTGKQPPSIGPDGKAMFANGAAAINILISKTTAESVLKANAQLESSQGPASLMAIAYNPSSGFATGSAGAGQLSIGGALNYVDVTTTARSLVENGVKIDAASGVTVLAQTTSPTDVRYASWWPGIENIFKGMFSSPPTDVGEGYDAGRRFLVNAFNGLMTLFGPLMSGDLGLSGFVFTTYSQASERTDPTSGKVGIAGAVNIYNRNNTAEASIGQGAIVNGGSDPNSPVLVKADIDNFSIDMAGLWSGGSLLTGGTVGGKGKSAGGAGQVVTVNNKAHAWIDDNAQVTGPAVVVQSHVKNNQIGIADSGIKATELAFSGAFNYRSVTNDVQSWIEDTAHVTGSQAVQVLAGAENYAVTVAGGWLEGTSTGMGLSGSVNIYNNTTAAFIGNKHINPAGATPGLITCQNSDHNGTVQIDATSTNRLVGIALAGASEWGPSKLAGIADVKLPATPSDLGDAGTSKFGLNISGDAAITVLNDNTQAYLSGSNVTADALQIAATNTLAAVLGTGNLVTNSGNGLAGSFSFLQGNRSAKAWTENTTVNAGQLSVLADFDDSFALGSAGCGISTDEVAVAGSVNVVNMTQKGWAWIGKQSHITTTGDVLVDAHSKQHVVSATGLFNYGKRAGIGAVVDLGFLNTDLVAGVFDTPSGNQESLSWLPTDQSDLAATDIQVNYGGNFAAATRYNGLLIAPSVCASFSDRLSIRGTGQSWNLQQRMLAAIGSGAVIGSLSSTGNAAVASYVDQTAILGAGTMGGGTGAGFGGSVGVLNLTRRTLARVGNNVQGYVHGNPTSLVQIDTGRKDASGNPIYITLGEGFAVDAEATDRIYTVIAGGQGGGKVQVAAGVLVGNQSAVTGAEIGQNARISQATGADAGQGVHVTTNDNVIFVAGNGQIVLGGSQAPAIGAVATTLNLARDVHATVGANVVLPVQQDIHVLADSTERIYNVTAAAGGGLSAGISGAANVNVVSSKTHASVGDGAQLATTAGNIQIRAHNDRQVTSAAAGLAVSGQGGLGGATQVNVLTADTQATIGANASLHAAGTSTGAMNVYTGQVNPDGTLATVGQHGLDLSAVNNHRLVAATVGGAAGKGVQIQPAVSVAINTANADATVGQGTTLNTQATQPQQSVSIGALNLNNMGLYTIGAGAGQVGVAPAVNVLSSTKRTTASVAANANLKAGGNIDLGALSADRINAVAAGGTFGQSVGVAATVSVANVANTTHATVGGNVDLQAGKNIGVSATDQTAVGKLLELATGETTVTSGSQANQKQPILVWPNFSSEGAWPEIAAQNGVKATGLDWVALPGPVCGVVGVALGVGGQVGTGATVATSVINKDTQATVLGLHGTGRSMTAGENILVHAQSEEALDAWTAAGAGSGTVGVAGAVNVRIVNPNVVALIGNGARINPTTGTPQGGNVQIVAQDTLKSTGLTGALSVAGVVGVTAVADVLVARPTVTSSLGVGGGVSILTPNDVLVQALGTNQLHAFAIGGGVATKVGIAPSVAVSVLNAAMDSKAAEMLNQNATGKHVDSAMQQNWLAGQVVLSPTLGQQVQQHLAGLNTGGVLDPATPIVPGGVTALIGNDVAITSQNLTLDARNSIDRLTVAGGLGAGLFAGVGAGVAVDSSHLSASALLGKVNLTTAGKTAVNSLVHRKGVTVAVAGAGGVGSAAGAIVVNAMDDNAKTDVAAEAKINSESASPGESVELLAQRDATLTSVTALAQVSAVGAGVSVNTNVLNGTASVNVGDSSKIRTSKHITLDALAHDTLTTAGGAVGFGGGMGGLASGAVNSLTGQTNVAIGSDVQLLTDGSMRLNALHDTKLTNLVGAVGFGGGIMAVPTVGVNVINKTTQVTLGKRTQLQASGAAGTALAISSGFDDHGHDFGSLNDYRIDRTDQNFTGLAITASNVEDVFSDTFGLSAAIGVGVAATVNTTSLNTKTAITTEPSCRLSGANVLLNSLGCTRVFGGAQTGSAAGMAGVAAATSVDVVNRSFETTLGDSTTISNVPGSVSLRSWGWLNGATLAAAGGAAMGAQATGAVGVQTVENTARTTLGNSVVVETPGPVEVTSLAYSNVRGRVGQGSVGGMAGIGAGIYVPQITTQAFTTTAANVRVSGTNSNDPRPSSIKFDSQAQTTVDGLAVSGTLGGLGLAAAGGVVGSSATTRAHTLLGNANTLKADTITLNAKGQAEQTLRAGGGSAAFLGAAGAGLGIANGLIDVRANGGKNLVAEATGMQVTATGNQRADVLTAAGAAAGIAVTGAVSVAHLGGAHDERTTKAVADVNSAATSAVDRARHALTSLSSSGAGAQAAATARQNVGAIQAAAGLSGAAAGTVEAALDIGSRISVGASGLAVKATGTSSTELVAGAGQLGLVGMGGAVAAGTIDGTIAADIGDQNTITTTGGGNVTVEATNGPWADDHKSRAAAYAEGGGLVGIGAGVATLNQNVNVRTHLGSATRITAPGAALRIASINNTFGTTYVHGLQVAGAAVSASVAANNVSGETTAAGTSEEVNVKDASIIAQYNATLDSKSYATGGGIVSGVGTSSTMNVSPIVRTTACAHWNTETFRMTPGMSLNGDIAVYGAANGGFAVGVGRAVINANPKLESILYGNSAVSASSLFENIATYRDNWTAYAGASTGNLVGGVGAASIIETKPTITTTIGGSAKVTGGTLVARNDVHSEVSSTATCVVGGVLAAGRIDNQVSLTPNLTLEIAANADLSGSTVNLESLVSALAKMHSHGAGGGAFAGGIACAPVLAYRPTNRVFLLSNQSGDYQGGGRIQATGDLTVLNRSDFTAQDPYTLVDFGGFGTGTGIEASLQTAATNLTVLGSGSTLTSGNNMNIFSQAMTSANNVQTETHNGAAGGAAVAWFRWTGADYQDLIFAKGSTAYAKGTLHAQTWTGKRGLAVTRATMVGVLGNRTEAHTIIQDAGGHNNLFVLDGAHLRGDNMMILHNLFNPWLTAEGHGTAGGAMLFGIGEAIIEICPQQFINLGPNSVVEGNQVVIRSTLNDRWFDATQYPTLNTVGDFTGITGPSPFNFTSGKAVSKLLGQWVINTAPGSVVRYATSKDIGVGGVAPNLTAWQDKIWNGIHYAGHGERTFGNGVVESIKGAVVQGPLPPAPVSIAGWAVAPVGDDSLLLDVPPDPNAFPNDLSKLDDLVAIYEYYKDHPEWVDEGLRTVLAELLMNAATEASNAEKNQWRYEMAALLDGIIPDRQRLALEQQSLAAEGMNPVLQSLAETLKTLVEDPRNRDGRMPEGRHLYSSLCALLRLNPHQDPTVAADIRDVMWFFEVFYGPVAKNTIVLPAGPDPLHRPRRPVSTAPLIRLDPPVESAPTLTFGRSLSLLINPGNHQSPEGQEPVATP
jgi:filamentous hemagglutinin family protein